MEFSKQAKTLPELVALLRSRGMIIADDEKAIHYLSNISYYRLSAYWYTFLQHPAADHLFRPGTRFEQVMDTYVFDRRLRLLLFDEIERIEIALRTQLIYHCCHTFGNNWYEDTAVFRTPLDCERLNERLMVEMRKTNEVFIKHYKRKYTHPQNPPAWMVLELASFGQLSMLFKNLKTSSAKHRIAAHFGLHERVLSSWLEALSYLRNTSAHHSRLWNRKMPKTPMIPRHPARQWLITLPASDKHNLLYLGLAAVRYLLQAVVPNSSFSVRLCALVDEYPEIPLHYMGFPEGWREEPLWKI